MPVVTKTTVRLYLPDIEIIDAWAAANPDPDTGVTPSRPTAIRRIIRSTGLHRVADIPDADEQPASRSDLDRALACILERLDGTSTSGTPPPTPTR